jgi:hypothetical protein
VSEDEDTNAREAAGVQSVFRTANERMRRLAATHRFETEQGVPFTCECADPMCREILMLSTKEYERVRAYPSRFVFVAGHEDGESPYERIVEAERGYAVVEMIGPAALEAVRLHPRRDET